MSTDQPAVTLNYFYFARFCIARETKSALEIYFLWVNLFYINKDMHISRVGR